MNKQVEKIVEVGVFLGIVVVFVDFFLFTIPPLNWLVLGIAFLFVAAIILDSIVRTIPREARKPTNDEPVSDEFESLEGLVTNVLRWRERESILILSEKLRGIALGAIAGRNRMSKNEIQELLEKGPASLRSRIKDSHLLKIATGRSPILHAADPREIEKILAEIEALST